MAVRYPIYNRHKSCCGAFTLSNPIGSHAVDSTHSFWLRLIQISVMQVKSLMRYPVFQAASFSSCFMHK